MRCLVISDLHLGSATDVDVLRRPGALDPLLEELARVDRLVLLGDTVELRHGPASDALLAARVTLERIASALRPDAEVLVTAGNHDYSMVAPYLDYASDPLGLETKVPLQLASPIARGVIETLGADRTELVYPGVWVRADVYAMHGHYSDFHTTFPLFERLVAGVMARLGATVPERGAEPEDYERALAPIYAWLDAVSQRTPRGRKTITSGEGGARIYRMIAGRGARPWSHRAVAVGFPLAVRAGVPLVGPLSADVSIAAVRRSALAAMGEVVDRLGIDARHVIFGHTHRAGPLETDLASEWVTPSGIHLHNTGNWVLERHFMPTPRPESPYWPGSAVLVEGNADPRLIRFSLDLI